MRSIKNGSSVKNDRSDPTDESSYYLDSNVTDVSDVSSLMSQSDSGGAIGEISSTSYSEAAEVTTEEDEKENIAKTVKEKVIISYQSCIKLHLCAETAVPQLQVHHLSH